MIAYKAMREAIAAGLKQYLSVPVIRGSQTAKAPAYPYVVYNVTTGAGENNGTYQRHRDGIDRLMVRSIWSISALSADWDESVSLAAKAREWFNHSGRAWLAEKGVTVQTTTEITNRDNVLTVEYERKNGFDVAFYVYDTAPGGANGYIEGAAITPERLN